MSDDHTFTEEVVAGILARRDHEEKRRRLDEETPLVCEEFLAALDAFGAKVSALIAAPPADIDLGLLYALDAEVPALRAKVVAAMPGPVQFIPRPDAR